MTNEEKIIEILDRHFGYHVNQGSIEIGDKEFLLKEKADGLEIIEITDKCIELRPQVANSIVLLCKKGGSK